MVQQRKYSNRKLSDFFDYISGKLSGKDRNAFERRLQKDPFEAEAAEGFAKVSREEAERDLERVASRIRSRIRRKRRIVWYSAAAAVASLMIVATIFFTVDDGSMDRYKTAPEFKEAAKEQPSGAVIEREKPKKEVIPEAEEAAKKEVIPEAQELQEEKLVMEEDRVMQEEERVSKDKMRQEEDPVIKKGLIQDEVQMKKEELMQDEDRVNYEDPGQVLSDEQREAGIIDAAELSKRAAPATPGEPVIREFQQDEVPELDEMQPAQVNILDEEVPAQMQEVPRRQVASETLRGQVQAVTTEQSVTSEQAVTRAQAASETLQGQVSGMEVASPVQDQVQGIVYSAENLKPLPGVSLFVKGTETGTVSDREGRFSLNTAEARESTLVANYIGMQTEEISLDASQPLEIAMLPEAMQLDEVVVVGHASTKKTMMTGAVATVEPDPVTEGDFISASPVDGIIQYNRYMDTTLVYPPAAGSGDREVVVLKFSISPNGRPENFRVIRSPGEPFTQEAIRVITSGPDWNPATLGGTYVDHEVRLRIVFRPG